MGGAGEGAGEVASVGRGLGRERTGPPAWGPQAGLRGPHRPRASAPPRSPTTHARLFATPPQLHPLNRLPPPFPPQKRHITVWRDDEGKLYMNDADGDVVSVPDTFKKGSEARVHEVNHLMLPGTVFSDPLSYSFDGGGRGF